MSEESNFNLSCQPIYQTSRVQHQEKPLWFATLHRETEKVEHSSNNLAFWWAAKWDVFCLSSQSAGGTGIVPWLRHLKTKEKGGQLAVVQQDSDWDQEKVHNHSFSYGRDGEEYNIPSKPWPFSELLKGSVFVSPPSECWWNWHYLVGIAKNNGKKKWVACCLKAPRISSQNFFTDLWRSSLLKPAQKN